MSDLPLPMPDLPLPMLGWHPATGLPVQRFDDSDQVWFLDTTSQVLDGVDTITWYSHTPGVAELVEELHRTRGLLAAEHEARMVAEQRLDEARTRRPRVVSRAG